MKLLLTSFTAVLLALCPHALQAAIILGPDSFDSQGSWVSRAPAGGGATFTGQATITGATNGQPSALYHSFSSQTLADGETLRLSVDVSTPNTTSRARDIRVAFGFANPLISGDGTAVGVPLSGYLLTLPSGGNTTDPRVSWTDNGGSDINFFNTGSSTVIGSPGLSNTVSVGTSFVPLVYEITRTGTDLSFTGSLDGTAFTGSVLATGADVISGYQFNTVGLAYLFQPGQTANFDNLTVELIPEPSSLGLMGGVLLFGAARRLRRRRGAY